MSSLGPDLNLLLANWWGTGVEGCSSSGIIAAASNLRFGGNSLWQISDFLAIYPKFGTGVQGVQTVGLIPSRIGSGFQVNDVLSPVQQPDASGAQFTVSAVDGGGGITALAVSNPGTGYQVNNSIQTANLSAGFAGTGYVVGDVLLIPQSGASGGQIQVTGVNSVGGIIAFILIARGTGYVTATGIGAIGGHGTGAEFDITTGMALVGGHGEGAAINITSISPFNLILPQIVLQMYVNLASASVSKARWCEMWPMAMSLFVAHYATLYLSSEGNPGTTAGQIAASGLEQGIVISQSAHDVSASAKPLIDDMKGWGTFTVTTYGAQLVSLARVVGMGGTYIP